MKRGAYFSAFQNEGQAVPLATVDAGKYCNFPALARVQMYGTGSSITLIGMDARAEQVSVVVVQCKQGLGDGGPSSIWI